MIPEKLRRLLAPSPFKAGCLVVLASCLLYASFGDGKPALLASFDNRGFDSMFHLRGDRPVTGQVVIVDIDEQSLAHLGQWPWPRHVVAQLVDTLRRGDARVVGFDIVFAEEDRTSPARCLEELASRAGDKTVLSAAGTTPVDTLDHDQALGAAVARQKTVLGYAFQTQDDDLKNDSDRPFPSLNFRISPDDVSFGDLNLLSAYRAIVNVPAIAQAETEGFFNVVPDAAGTVRKVPLFMEMDGMPYPSLALEMLRLGEELPDAVLHVARSADGGSLGVLGVSLGKHLIPTDAYGQVTVNYRGGPGKFRTVSAAEILMERQLDAVHDKYVLIGTSAVGLNDLRATPFANVYPGVEIHATIIDNILSDDLFTHDLYTERGITFVLIFTGGLLLSALLAFGGPSACALGGLFFLGATAAGNYYGFFLRNQLLGLSYPMITALAVFLVVTLANYFFVGREKRFIQKAFGRYVSPDVVQQLAKNPKGLTLSGEERELSVLFCDLRDFTSISEKMTPDQLGRFMNRYLTAMSTIIMSGKGTVDKFIGDAIMALWGAPLDDPEHAFHSVAAALEMIRRVESLNREWQSEGLPHIAVGIGINTGLMSVGNFGSSERFSYTVLGDNVNLASRLEGLSKTYGAPIIIAEATRNILGDRVFCRQLDRVLVKGKQLPVSIYEPLTVGIPEEAVNEEVALFEKALEAYFRQRFTEAREILVELQSRQPKKLYTLYQRRIENYLVHPPPADWDGVSAFTTK